MTVIGGSCHTETNRRGGVIVLLAVATVVIFYLVEDVVDSG